VNNSLSTIAAVVTNSLAASGLVGATPLGLLLTTGMVSVTTIDVYLRKLVKSPSYMIKLFRDIRMTNLVALHVSDFVKKSWLMITLLNFFESPIKPLTSILRFVNLGYIHEINLHKMAFSFPKMNWSKRSKEAWMEEWNHLSELRFGVLPVSKAGSPKRFCLDRIIGLPI